QRQANGLYTLSGQETHVFCPTVVNTATFGWSRAWANQDAVPDEPFPDSLLFLKGGDRSNPGALIIGGGTSTAQASTFTSANGQNPINSSRQNFTGSNDLRLTKGRHSLSMGAWFQWVQQGVFSSVQNNAGTLTYRTLLDMLQDRPSQFQAGVGIHNDLQNNLANRMNSNAPFNGRLVITNTPVLTMLRNGPIPSQTPPAPSCSAELQSPACSIYAPGGIDPAMHTPTTQEWS